MSRHGNGVTTGEQSSFFVTENLRRSVATGMAVWFRDTTGLARRRHDGAHAQCGQQRVVCAHCVCNNALCCALFGSLNETLFMGTV